VLSTIRRGLTGLAVAGALAGGALVIGAPANAAQASPQQSADVIAGPFDNSVQCWNEYDSLDAGTEWPQSGCVFGSRIAYDNNWYTGWWLISDASVST
jgi:hypothetical protein